MRKSLNAVQVGVVLSLGLILAGCADDEPISPVASYAAANLNRSGSPPAPPAGLVEIEWNGERLSLWPYTGSDFGSQTVDPINLVFFGEATPVQIRAALLALDGDRTAFGFPPAPPFNDTWSDAMGGVQTAYADGGGWVGSVVQLELGSYGPVRFHLRLFETRNPFAPEGTWTLGAAHFEILIPGTTNHQVMCWELAEQIVIADLVRSGLLGAAPASSGPINAAPTYRDIPAVIYNGVPDELKLACGLPPGSASGDVPIPSDGEATLLYLARSVALSPERRDENFTIEFSQLIPKPFCSTGPADFLLVEGPVTLRRSTRVTTEGRYAYHAMIRGLLTATPVDVTQNPPVIVGEPFKVTASDVQQGYISFGDGNSRVAMQSQRIIIGNGAEKQFVWLEIHERGSKDYREIVQCLTD